MYRPLDEVSNASLLVDDDGAKPRLNQPQNDVGASSPTHKAGAGMSKTRKIKRESKFMGVCR